MIGHQTMRIKFDGPTIVNYSLSIERKDEKKNIANLMKYARERRVVKKVQSMIGVWL